MGDAQRHTGAVCEPERLSPVAYGVGVRRFRSLVMRASMVAHGSESSDGSERDEHYARLREIHGFAEARQ
jgi:hypothetical protein